MFRVLINIIKFTLILLLFVQTNVTLATYECKIVVPDLPRLPRGAKANFKLIEDFILDYLKEPGASLKPNPFTSKKSNKLNIFFKSHSISEKFKSIGSIYSYIWRNYPGRWKSFASERLQVDLKEKQIEIKKKIIDAQIEEARQLLSDYLNHPEAKLYPNPFLPENQNAIIQALFDAREGESNFSNPFYIFAFIHRNYDGGWEKFFLDKFGINLKAEQEKEKKESIEKKISQITRFIQEYLNEPDTSLYPSPLHPDYKHLLQPFLDNHEIKEVFDAGTKMRYFIDNNYPGKWKQYLKDKFNTSLKKIRKEYLELIIEKKLKIIAELIRDYSKVEGHKLNAVSFQRNDPHIVSFLSQHSASEHLGTPYSIYWYVNRRKKNKWDGLLSETGNNPDLIRLNHIGQLWKLTQEHQNDRLRSLARLSDMASGGVANEWVDGEPTKVMIEKDNPESLFLIEESKKTLDTYFYELSDIQQKIVFTALDFVADPENYSRDLLTEKFLTYFHEQNGSSLKLEQLMEVFEILKNNEALQHILE